MTIKTTADALARSAETSGLLRRAVEAVDKAHLFGPVGLAEFIEPIQRLRAALENSVPELERIIKQRLR